MRRLEGRIERLEAARGTRRMVFIFDGGRDAISRHVAAHPEDRGHKVMDIAAVPDSRTESFLRSLTMEQLDAAIATLEEGITDEAT